eukprot:4798584-Pyramimonas_sp.AAC.1
MRRAFCRAYPQKAIAAAQVQLAEAAAAGDPDVNPGARQTVKAGMIIDYMAKDPLGHSHRKVLALQGPMQVFLDYVFKCEA